MPMPPGGLAGCGALNRETRRGCGIGEPLVRGPSRSPAPERGKGGEAFASHGKSECPCLDMVRTVAPLTRTTSSELRPTPEWAPGETPWHSVSNYQPRALEEPSPGPDAPQGARHRVRGMGFPLVWPDRLVSGGCFGIVTFAALDADGTACGAWAAPEVGG